MQWHDTLSWYWMAPTLLLWILALGAVVHAAVHPGHHRSQRR